MILLPTLQAVIITPPKTASSSLSDTLCGPGCPGTYHEGLDPIAPWPTRHTRTPPPEAAEWDRWLVVRNPWDRLVSLYHHLGRWQLKQGLGMCSFRVFLDLLTDPGDFLDAFYRARQLGFATSVTRVLHVESLESDLQAAGLPFTLPRHNASDRFETARYFVGDCLQVADKLTFPDAQAFGYTWAP